MSNKKKLSNQEVNEQGKILEKMIIEVNKIIEKYDESGVSIFVRMQYIMFEIMLNTSLMFMKSGKNDSEYVSLIEKNMNEAWKMAKGMEDGSNS